MKKPSWLRADMQCEHFPDKEEKIRKALKQQGIRIEAVGLTEKEREIIKEAIRKIEYGRKKGNCQFLPYLMELK